MSTTRKITAGFSLIAALAIGGCTQQGPQLTLSTAMQTGMDQTPRHGTLTHASTESNAVFAELIAWLSSSDMDDSQTTAAPGPRLAAGDWLAFQCAMAGGYGEQSRSLRLPVFAEANAQIDQSR